jgi:hypothetical protein
MTGVVKEPPLQVAIPALPQGSPILICHAQKERQLPAFALLRDPSMRCSNAYIGIHELLPGSEECHEKCLQEVVSYASSMPQSPTNVAHIVRGVMCTEMRGYLLFQVV